MEKQRKFLLAIPLLVIPFVTMAFWALGGGRPSVEQRPSARGIDMTLPEAQFKKDEKKDKLSVYQAALRDSTQNGVNPAFMKALGMKNTDSVQTSGAPDADQSAARIRAKLAEINHQLSQPPAEQPVPDPSSDGSEQKLRELHQLMRTAGSSGRPDPFPRSRIPRYPRACHGHVRVAQ